MRDPILAGLSNLTLGTFTVSSERPWDSSGTPLYLKNRKVFYVSEPDQTDDHIVKTLDSRGVVNRSTTVQVFVTCDAKAPPSNYADLVSAVQDLRLLSTIAGTQTRECDVITTFDADILITEFEFRFTELKSNL